MPKPIEYETEFGVGIADLYSPKVPNGAAVLILHGAYSAAANYAYCANPLVEAGVTCLVPDLKGFGRRNAEESGMRVGAHLGEIAIAREILLAQPGLESPRLGILGASYGGYLALRHIASYPGVESLLLRAPAALPNQINYIGIEHIPFSTEMLEALYKFQTQDWSVESNRKRLFGLLSAKALARFDGNITIVTSSEDEVVPVGVTDTYAYVAKHAKTQIIEGAKHDLTPADKEAFREIVIEWAKDLYTS